MIKMRQILNKVSNVNVGSDVERIKFSKILMNFTRMVKVSNTKKLGTATC